MLKPLRRREAAFTVTPSVNLDLEASDDALVIEATGRDRPGLLHALAKTLSDIGLSLEAARIDGYGERAVDTFYVTENGHKPSGDARLAGIKVHLMNRSRSTAPNRASSPRPPAQGARPCVCCAPLRLWAGSPC